MNEHCEQNSSTKIKSYFVKVHTGNQTFYLLMN